MKSHDVAPQPRENDLASYPYQRSNSDGDHNVAGVDGLPQVHRRVSGRTRTESEGDSTRHPPTSGPNRIARSTTIANGSSSHLHHLGHQQHFHPTSNARSTSGSGHKSRTGGRQIGGSGRGQGPLYPTIQNSYPDADFPDRSDSMFTTHPAAGVAGYSMSMAAEPPRYGSKTSTNLDDVDAKMESIYNDVVGPSRSSIPPGHSPPSLGRHGSQGGDDALSSPGKLRADILVPARKSSHVGTTKLIGSGSSGSSASSSLISQREIEDAEDNAIQLQNSVARNAGADQIHMLLTLCVSSQARLQMALQNYDADPNQVSDYQKLIHLNDALVEAVNMGRNAISKPPPPTPKPPPPLPPDDKDTFSLICLLRAQQSERRLNAALVLLSYARDAALGRSDECILLRDEILSSGGMNSLLALFKASSSDFALKVVAALTVAYLLPAYLETSTRTPPPMAWKIVECLRLLSTSQSINPNGKIITSEETSSAAAHSLIKFWSLYLWPMLISEDTGVSDSIGTGAGRKHGLDFSPASVVLGRNRSRGSRSRFPGGMIFDQRDETIAIQSILEQAVALIIGVSDHIESNPSLSKNRDFLGKYPSVIEEICSIEKARPIAVREGILQILVSWMNSRDLEKVRPAAVGLRELTAINDGYMAGWIHSQMVNKGAVLELANLARDNYIGHDVKLAIAQVLSSLCVAPHTRAAVVEAGCVQFLIGILYLHTEPSSERVVYFAGRALLQLAAGSIQRAIVLNGENGDAEVDSLDRRVTLIDELIVEGDIITPFVAIARKKQCNLRTVAVEALRVLSEDISPSRQTRLKLCKEGAGSALGVALTDGVDAIVVAQKDVSTVHPDKLKELHEALCALANILDPVQEGLAPPTYLARGNTNPSRMDPKPDVIKGCLDTAGSGGLRALLDVAAIPLVSARFEHEYDPTIHLLEEACRSLASMSILLLSEDTIKTGLASWALDVFIAMHRVLMQLFNLESPDDGPSSNDLAAIVLQGLAALAMSDPLKVRMVDRTLPYLLKAKGVLDQADICNAASQAFQSLGFADDELASQVAGNNPSLLADWFCLQRSLLIQAMARSEIRLMLVDTWEAAFLETRHPTATKLIRGTSDASWGEDSTVSGTELFESFADDRETSEARKSILRQYRNMFDGKKPQDFRIHSSSTEPLAGSDAPDGLLCRQVYPLNNSDVETDWILTHQRNLEKARRRQRVNWGSALSNNVEQLLVRCFPSDLCRDQVVPVFSYRPAASFNFRALMMPQRLYFSFRREGQLLSTLCDQEVAKLEVQDHCTLAFTNSSFAGEFAESLVQALYRCAMIQGLSFSRDESWPTIRDSDEENRGAEGAAQLANLAGSLPPWISNLTFDGILDDKDVQNLVKILENMARLSSGPTHSNAASQGKFRFFAVRRSPQVSRNVWKAFFNLVGRPKSASLLQMRFPRALSSLTSLDLSGNQLGDELCADLLELVFFPSSGCSLEHLDLSGNRIESGDKVLGVLQTYADLHHRLSMQQGRNAWKSPLLTLKLGSNDLYHNRTWLHMIVLFQQDGFSMETIDLSSNGLMLSDNDRSQTDQFIEAILVNKTLCHLNLSRNKFSEYAIDRMTMLLKESEGTGLSFLRFEGNTPPLSSRQIEDLNVFLLRSRKVCLQGNRSERPARRVEPRSNPIPISTADDETVYSDPANFNPADNMITVLFSAPLVFRQSTNYLPFKKLDFEMERELMWQCLKEASRDIELQFDCATHNRLLATISKRCGCLHYSGHGHERFLPLEDGSGEAHWFDVDKFKSLIAESGKSPFKFVFVSACHSELAGRTFADAGVPHVVCCKQDSELKDQAALTFTQNFYLALAWGRTVKDSFEQGKRAVLASPNLRNPDEEMGKFLLLPHDGDHDKVIFNARPIPEWPKPLAYRLAGPAGRGGGRRHMSRAKSINLAGAKSAELSVRNWMQADPAPSPPQFFLGREVEMYYVLKAVLEKRLVSVVGEAGTGRSSLVCALCHYINERASVIIAITHIYYVRVKQNRKGKNRLRKLVKHLLQLLVDNGKTQAIDSDCDMEDMFEAICKALKQEKALVVFDRVEYLVDSDEAHEFPMLLSRLCKDTRDVRVLMTNRRQLGIPSLGEQHFTLGPLNFENTAQLFANLCPYLHSSSDRRRFVKSVVRDDDEKELLPTDPLTESTRELFRRFGDGIPARIENAAHQFDKDELYNLKRSEDE